MVECSAVARTTRVRFSVTVLSSLFKKETWERKLNSPKNLNKGRLIVKETTFPYRGEKWKQ